MNEQREDTVSTRAHSWAGHPLMSLPQHTEPPSCFLSANLEQLWGGTTIRQPRSQQTKESVRSQPDPDPHICTLRDRHTPKLHMHVSAHVTFAISGTSGSSGLGSLSREQMDSRTFEMVSAGDQLSLKKDRRNK